MDWQLASLNGPYLDVFRESKKSEAERSPNLAKFADALAELYRPYFPLSILRFYAPYGPGLEGRMLTDIANRVRNGKRALGKGGHFKHAHWAIPQYCFGRTEHRAIGGNRCGTNI